MEPADAMSYLNWRRYISAATILGGNLEKVVSEMTIKHLSPGGYFINGGRSSFSLFFMLLKGAAAMWLLEVLCAAVRLYIIFLFSRQLEKTKSQVRYLVHSSSSSQRKKVKRTTPLSGFS
jgi:hypothetical protein